MSLGSEISALILTFNEGPNIGRTLEKLKWVKDVLLIDSFSLDETISIAKSFENVRLMQRRFKSFADQCNFGLNHISTAWVLSLDADYILSDGFSEEIQKLNIKSDVDGFRAHFQYCINGYPLRSSLYPPRIVLYRRIKARYRDEGHGHRVQIDGNVKNLKSLILHDDRKPIVQWIFAQKRYAEEEVEYLLAEQNRGEVPLVFNFADRVRQKVFLAPALVFLYTLFWKRLILDGWPGLFYVFQRTLAELLLSLFLLEKLLSDQNSIRRLQ